MEEAEAKSTLMLKVMHLRVMTAAPWQFFNIMLNDNKVTPWMHSALLSNPFCKIHSAYHLHLPYDTWDIIDNLARDAVRFTIGPEVMVTISGPEYLPRLCKLLAANDQQIYDRLCAAIAARRVGQSTMLRWKSKDDVASIVDKLSQSDSHNFRFKNIIPCNLALYLYSVAEVMALVSSAALTNFLATIDEVQRSGYEPIASLPVKHLLRPEHTADDWVTMFFQYTPLTIRPLVSIVMGYVDPPRLPPRPVMIQRILQM